MIVLLVGCSLVVLETSIHKEEEERGGCQGKMFTKHLNLSLTSRTPVPLGQLEKLD